MAEAALHTYRAHGLLVASTVDLPLPPGRHGSDRPDLLLGPVREQVVPDGHPPGQLLAATTRQDGTLLYGLGRDDGRCVLRYPGLCEFVGDTTLSEVAVHLHPGMDPGLVRVLAAGALIAIHLRLRHELVLHASAVRVGGRALAFVGASGMGKSTLAAALCREGHELVSDDVLRIDLADPTVVRAHPGSTETRLRLTARQLADMAPPDTVAPTADGRLAVRPAAWSTAPLPLLACVVPRPSHAGEDDVAVTRLPLVASLLRLSQFPRIVGWIDPISAAADFQALGDLVERVPVFDARIPWGLPFRPGVLDRLVDAVSPVDAAT
jgi:HPr Serine kinase C-terminal domain